MTNPEFKGSNIETTNLYYNNYINNIVLPNDSSNYNLLPNNSNDVSGRGYIPPINDNNEFASLDQLLNN